MRRSIVVLIAAFSVALSFAAAAGARFLPDQATTPGALNPMVTQENIDLTICRRGWTHTIRPPERYTERLKREQLYTPSSPYFAPGERLGAFEEDHRVPLGLGGEPHDRRNLWPEPRFSRWSAARKDELEGLVHNRVCRGRLTLAQGRAAFLGDWTEAYRRYLGEPWRSEATGLDRDAPARARDQPPALAPLPPLVKPQITAPHCTWVWRPTGPGRGPWFFKICP